MNKLNHPTPGRRAIVLGASMAGLLAARVLQPHFDEVLLLDRDELPGHAAARKGTPHAVHPHGLLARGREVLESLFPGFTDALEAQGALCGDAGAHVAIDANGQRLARQTLGHQGVTASRLAIEAELRRRVRQLPGVDLRSGVDVLHPVHEGDRVVGVRWRAASGVGGEQTLHALLVVDCTGRGSRTPAWLREWGYEAPVEERVAIGLCYVSAYFKRDGSVRPETTVVIGAATPELPRPSVLIAQEADEHGQARWVAGVGGYTGDHVEPRLDAMLARAKAIGQNEIADLAEHGELMGPVIRYGFPHSQRRHYQRLRRFPQGYLVMGDALASFNPIYGQGMTVAACEALALREAMGKPDAGLARRFFKAAARVIDNPWQVSVGGDLALPMVQGHRPAPVKLINAYLGRLQRVAVHDAVVAGAFQRVVHMLDQPPSLMAPRIMWRVWRGTRALNKAASAPATGQTRAPQRVSH